MNFIQFLTKMNFMLYILGSMTCLDFKYIRNEKRIILMINLFVSPIQSSLNIYQRILVCKVSSWVLNLYRHMYGQLRIESCGEIDTKKRN